MAQAEAVKDALVGFLSSSSAALVCLVLSGAWPEFASAQDHAALAKATLHQIYSIGEDETRPLHELLSQPVGIVTDEEMRVYVADRKDHSVKVFDDQGSYLYPIGSQGRGPNEFQEIRGVTLLPDGSLLVSDYGNGRITRLTRSGDVVETYSVRAGMLSAVGEIPQPIGERSYIMLYLSTSPQDGPLKELFHVLNEHFAPVGVRFGTLGWHGDADDPFWVRTHALNPGHLLVEDSKHVLYSPFLYDGQLFQYENKGGTWSLVKTINGYTETEHPFEREGSNRGSRADGSSKLLTQTHYYGGEGPISGRIYNMSHGLFNLKDGRVIHLSTLWVDEAYSLYIEVFDSSKVLVGHGPVGVPADLDNEDFDSSVDVVWKDAQDRFYLIDSSSGFPVIRVVELRIPNL